MRDSRHTPEPAAIIQTSQSYLSLLTPPHPSLPGATTRQAAAHNSSLSLPVTHPAASPCAPCDRVLPSYWQLWVTNYLFNGNHLLICWPPPTSYFLLIHSILEQYHGPKNDHVPCSPPTRLASPWSGPTSSLPRQDQRFPSLAH